MINNNWSVCDQRMKAELIRNVQSRLNELLERALSDSMQSLYRNTHTHPDHTHTHDRWAPPLWCHFLPGSFRSEEGLLFFRHKLDQGKVFVSRCSLLEWVLILLLTHQRLITHSEERNHPSNHIATNQRTYLTYLLCSSHQTEQKRWTA